MTKTVPTDDRGRQSRNGDWSPAVAEPADKNWSGRLCSAVRFCSAVGSLACLGRLHSCIVLEESAGGVRSWIRGQWDSDVARNGAMGVGQGYNGGLLALVSIFISFISSYRWSDG